MDKHKLSQILAILVIFSLMSGCGSRASVKTATPALPPTITAQPATATLPPSTPAPTSTLPPPTLAPVAIVEGSFPVGTYTCEVGADKGTWTLRANGTYGQPWNLRREGTDIQETDYGTYTVTGDQITITASVDSQYCFGQEMGTYTWSFDGQALSVKSLGDKCAVREYVIVSCHWLMQP